MGSEDREVGTEVTKREREGLCEIVRLLLSEDGYDAGMMRLADMAGIRIALHFLSGTTATPINELAHGGNRTFKVTNLPEPISEARILNEHENAGRVDDVVAISHSELEEIQPACS